ncbi:MAG: EAL domain-containing protein [Bdellovibrio sp.]|nr:EAL domain-containing protein [Methylotenera sp.]
MFDGYNFWLIFLSVLLTSIALFYSCNFIRRLYLSAPADKVALLPLYSITMGSMLFCIHNLNWVAMNPHVGSKLSIPMMSGSLFAAIFATFNILHNASERHLPFTTLVNRGFIVGLASYAMFYLSFASWQPSNSIYLDTTNFFIAIFSSTVICAIAVLYYFKMKSYENNRPIFLKATLSLGVGLLIVVLHSIFNTTIITQAQILATTVHTVNKGLFATIFSSLIACLLALTFTAHQSIEKFKAILSKLYLSESPSVDNFNAKDALTQLPNRHGFESHLNAAVKRSARLGKTIALAYIDLDHFKPINDTYGHHIGDAVLVAAAQRLNATVRACDYVARLGGDEFVAIIEDITFDEDITPIISRLVNSIKETFHVDNHHIDISCSVGVAVYPGDGDIQKLIVCADAAMYKAKENGKNQFKFFDAAIELASDQMLEIRNDLRQAIDNQEFFLLFQPKIDCKTQKPVGAEALIRWNHPLRGQLSPDAFLAAAERFGLIGYINDWVLEETCRTIHRAKTLGINLNLSINLAHQQFRDANLVIDILKVMQSFDISQNNLTFEIKETIAINNEILFLTLLENFKDANIKVALDDFGTHNFNLGYLQKLSINEVKLDRVFIAQMNDSKSSHAIVDAVIRLAHALKLNVVAEGVETEAQRCALTELGCNHMQGYLFSQAISEKKLMALFIQNNLYSDASGTYLLSDFHYSSVTTDAAKTLN